MTVRTCPDCGHEVEAHIGGSCRYVYNSDLREQCECSWMPAAPEGEMYDVVLEGKVLGSFRSKKPIKDPRA